MRKFGVLMVLILTGISLHAQYRLSGRIADEQNEPLGGATISLVGTYRGAVSGPRGEFHLDNLKKGEYKLVVSFIGYKIFEKTYQVVSDQQVEIKLETASVLTEEVMVSATRAGNNSPIAYTNLNKESISQRNLGQDLPYLLNSTPSFVATSDAGNGVGYTNFRIRGTDLNRINVTINGIPMSEAESHATYFVDIPDIASATENVQIQRGVGNSTNGAAAFGATIDLQTSQASQKPYAELNSTAGSFGTFKNNLRTGTGLLNGKFAVEASLSKISSDGFVDRGRSDLKSYYLSGGYYGAKTVVKATLFSGFEETYQAWNGVPSVRLNNDINGMKKYGEDGLYSDLQVDQMLKSNSRTYNLYTYKNQVDHYLQDHYQIHLSHQFNPNWNLNGALFYTYGRGYYEQFENDQKYADYQLAEPIINGQTIKTTDLISRKWLDNDFYGTIFSLVYRKGLNSLIIGGGANRYQGRHFGRVIWEKIAGDASMDHQWYHGTGDKTDANLYARYSFALSDKLIASADVQYRTINYEIDGIDDHLRNLTQKHSFDFFNPKMGLVYTPNSNQELYASFGVAHREPNRDNFVDADPSGKKPTYETLNDFEGGYRYRNSWINLGANIYLMNYKNQLILTGQINDVGSPIMTNVDKSYRTGIELTGEVKVAEKLNLQLNATFSRNRIKDFTEYVENWDTGGLDAIKIGETHLAFSPSVLLSHSIKYRPARNVEISLLSNYVGKQYIDNTSSDDRMLKAYYVSNLLINYTIKQRLFESMKVNLMVNNLFDKQYESNAWVYSYYYGGTRNKMDGYFPQAGTNVMVGMSIRF